MRFDSKHNIKITKKDIIIKETSLVMLESRFKTLNLKQY